MSRINRRRALPPIPHDANPQLRQYLQSQQEITEIGEGVRGDPLDRKLTIRDLVNAGIVKLKGAFGKYIDPNNMEPGDKVGNDIKDMAIPPRPRGVQAVAVIGANVIFWDNPAKQYNNHSHAEVWRAESPGAFDTAILIGTSAGSSFTDYTVTGGITYTYWVRFISTSDVEGPLHSPQGVQLEAVKTAEQILRELNEEFANTDPSAGNLQEDFIIDARRFAIRTGATGQTKIPFAVLNNGTVIMQNVLIDQGILGPISFGKIIDSDGLPVTNVAGRLKADYIDAQNLSVKEAADFTGDLQSTNFLTGVRGWRLRKTGDIELNAAQIRGLLDFGQITVQGRPASEHKQHSSPHSGSVSMSVNHQSWAASSFTMSSTQVAQTSTFSSDFSSTASYRLVSLLRARVRVNIRETDTICTDCDPRFSANLSAILSLKCKGRHIYIQEIPFSFSVGKVDTNGQLLLGNWQYISASDTGFIGTNSFYSVDLETDVAINGNTNRVTQTTGTTIFRFDVTIELEEVERPRVIFNRF